MKQAQFFSPFEVLFKDFMKTGHLDNWDLNDSILNTKFNHPVDILETPTGLQIEVAAVGIEKEEIDIKVESGDILRVVYFKPERQLSTEKVDGNGKVDLTYIQRGSAKRSFNLGWKVSGKFDLKKLKAKLDKGLLVIQIPFAENAEPKKITIE
jgi:HSP20 family molecular chaperone IbpA